MWKEGFESQNSNFECYAVSKRNIFQNEKFCIALGNMCIIYFFLQK